MRPQHRTNYRFLALAAAVVLLLAIAVADEPLTSPDPTFPTSSQTPEPVPNFEPSLPGKSEASGESEIATPSEQLTTVMPSVSFAAADRSHTDDVNVAQLNSDASSLGSFSLEPMAGESQSGPSMESPSQSQESQESLDHDGDSEESLASQGM